jgi:hypothetical protein
MYKIFVARDGTCVCECEIQDGRETCTAPNRQIATYKLIQMARMLNHAYIREDDIEYLNTPSRPKEDCEGCQEWKVMRDRISRGEVRVVEVIMSKPFQYRITDEECEMVVAIREGRQEVVRGQCHEEERDIDPAN